jgi:hypothetical protein
MMTDAQGRFQFSNLAPGRYTVSAQKAGFALVVFGQRYYGRGGRAIPLREAEQRDIRVQLPHLNVITGRIVDERGNPLIRASVRALRFSMAFGYRRGMSVGTATTDNRGMFRIDSLTPGDYVVCASTQETAPLNDAQRLRMQIDSQRRLAAFVLGPQGVEAQKALAPRLVALEAQLPPFVPPVHGFAPMCYPNPTSTLSTMTLAPNEERTGVDMQLVPIRLARIEGVVKGMPPDQRGLDPILLFSGDDRLEGMGQDSVRPDFEGRFSFTNVSPGPYELVLRGAANGPAGGPLVKAVADVVVADADIHNVVLDLQQGVSVSGRVVFRPKGAQPDAGLLERGGLEVRLDPAVPAPLTRYPGPSIARPDASGQFVLHDVFPGRYRLSASQRQTTGWFEDLTTIPDADVSGQLVEVKRQDVAGLTVTLTDQRGEISGSIVTEKGEPAPEYFILLYPSEEKYWNPYSLRLRGTRANQDGRFVISGVPAGTYRLATILDAEVGAWFDPAYLRRIDPGSMTVTFTGDEKKTLNLRVPDDR